MEQLLVNARLLGWANPDLTHLMEYVFVGSEILDVPIPAGFPVVGRDAFRTSTGVHASAIVKACAKGEAGLEDLVYSAVPAGWFQRRQRIDVGPMSGASNVRHWLLAHGYMPGAELVQRVFALAKESDRILTDDELHEVVARVLGSAG
jgi:2-isopropylmalate synthase